MDVFRRLEEIARLFAWLDQRGTSDLGQWDTADCEAYLAHRRDVLEDDGVVIGQQSPGTRRSAAQAITDLIAYRELFTADQVRAGLRP
jgi:hypothetical protein